MKRKKNPKRKTRPKGALSAPQKVAKLQAELDAFRRAAAQMLELAEEKALRYERRSKAWKALARKRSGLEPYFPPRDPSEAGGTYAGVDRAPGRCVSELHDPADS